MKICCEAIDFVFFTFSILLEYLNRTAEVMSLKSGDRPGITQYNWWRLFVEYHFPCGAFWPNQISASVIVPRLSIKIVQSWR